MSFSISTSKTSGLLQFDSLLVLTRTALGLGLGRSPDAYVETVVPWGPGDRLLMYTDGLSEARDSRGEFFPVASLDGVVRAGSVQEAAEGTVVAVNKHVPRGRLEDDLAVVVIEHLPGVTPIRSGSLSVQRAPGRSDTPAAASRAPALRP